MAVRPTDSIVFTTVQKLLRAISGDVVCRKLKENPTTAKIPVILLTAKQEAGEDVYRQWGASDYLIKPVEPVLLRARVAACLEMRRLRARAGLVGGGSS